MTRLRPVAGDADLARQVLETAREAARRRADGDILEQVAEMRALMDEERPPRGSWDIKLAPGGLVDIEFIAQALQLKQAANPNYHFEANTDAALQSLMRHGALGQREGAALRAAWSLYSAVRQAQGALDCSDLSRALPFQRQAAARILGAPVAGLRGRLTQTQSRVRELFERLVKPVRLNVAA